MPTRHAPDPITVGGTPPPLMQLMLETLPAQHREIIIATYFDGRTTREAARLLGLTHTAATELLYQAMRSLCLMDAICRPEHGGPDSADSPESTRRRQPHRVAAPFEPGRVLGQPLAKHRRLRLGRHTSAT